MADFPSLDKQPPSTKAALQRSQSIGGPTRVARTKLIKAAMKNDIWNQRGPKEWIGKGLLMIYGYCTHQ